MDSFRTLQNLLEATALAWAWGRSPGACSTTLGQLHGPWQNPGWGGCSGGGPGPVPWDGGRRDTQAQCGGWWEERLARNFLELLFGPPDPSRI